MPSSRDRHEEPSASGATPPGARRLRVVLGAGALLATLAGLELASLARTPSATEPVGSTIATTRAAGAPGPAARAELGAVGRGGPSEELPARDEVEGPAPTTSAPPSSAPPPRSTARANDVEVDPCAERDDSPTHDEPLELIVNVRLAELDDRARVLLADADSDALSPELRQALAGVLVERRTELTLVELAARARDRRDEGFDYAAALALSIAVRLDHAHAAREASREGAGEGIPADVRAALNAAERLAPADDPAPFVLEAILHARRRARSELVDALREALRRDPTEPAVSLELAHQLGRTIELDEAFRVVDALLDVHPGDVDALRFRARMRRRVEGVGPSPSHLTVRGVSVLYPRLDGALVRRAAETIATALDRSAHTLGIARRESLAVFVHRSPEAMRRAMCGQGWTAAAYDGVLHLALPTLTAPDRDEVLAHESVHAALHDVPRALPFWIDEGLAQALAAEQTGPSEGRARDAEASFARLVRTGTPIPFASLNGAFLDISDPDDARLAYHQSLAMVRWLVAQRGPRGLAELVAEVARHPDAMQSDPAELLARVAGRPFDGRVLLSFLAVR